MRIFVIRRCTFRCAANFIAGVTVFCLLFFNTSMYYSNLSEISDLPVTTQKNSRGIQVRMANQTLPPAKSNDKFLISEDEAETEPPSRNYDEIERPSSPGNPDELKRKPPLLSEIEPILEDPNDFAPEFPFPVPNLVIKDPPSFHIKKFTPKDKCKTPYPKNEDLQFNNIIWQVLRAPNWTLFLHGAYYDDRMVKEKKRGQPCVRVIALGDRLDIGRNQNTEFWCQLWFPNLAKPKLVKATGFRSLWPKEFGFLKNGIALPIMFSCGLHKSFKLKKTDRPFAVSLVKKKCSRAKNKLRVFYNPQTRSKKEDFAVCVKGLDFPQTDISLKLVEWIELLRILGAHKIYFYQYSVHPNTKKVLEYYKRKDQIDVKPLTLPGEFPNEPLVRSDYLHHHRTRKRQLETIPYNDCLYRYMYQYKYMAILDIDEIIVPLKVNTWKQLLQKHKYNGTSKAKRPSSFNAQQNGCYFEGVKRKWFPDMPKYMHMLQHVYKVPSKPDENKRPSAASKSFIDPSRVQIVLNHWPHVCLPGACRLTLLDQSEAQLQHYKHFRYHCGLPKKNITCSELSCLKYVKDTSLWKYKTKLIERVTKVKNELKLPFV